MKNMYPAVNNEVKDRNNHQRANTVGGTFEYSNRTVMKNYGNTEILPGTAHAKPKDAMIRIRDGEKSSRLEVIQRE